MKNNSLNRISLGALLFLFILPTTFAWYDASYGNRTQINITNTAGAVSNIEIVINSTDVISTGFDTQTLISRKFMQADCDDLLFVSSDDTANFTFYIENNTCNTPNTVIHLVGNLSTGTNSIFAYFNNSAATNHQSITGVASQLSGLYAYFDFENGQSVNVRDYSTRAINGTLKPGTGTANYSSGRGYASSYTPNGVTNLSGVLVNGTVNLTIEMWIYNNKTVQVSNSAIFSDIGSSGTVGMMFYSDNGSTTNYRFTYGDGSGWNIGNGFTLPFGQWSYVTIVKIDKNVTIFVNGTSAVSDVHAGSASMALPNTQFSFAGRNVATPDRAFNGSVDNFRLRYNYADTVTTMRARYNGLAWVFGGIETDSGEDTTLPTVTVINPTNMTNLTSTYMLNFTAVDASGIDECWWINSTGANQSLSSCSGATWTEAYQGTKSLTVCANDTLDNVRCVDRNFTYYQLPSWSLNSTNTTIAGLNTTFSVFWGMSHSGALMSDYYFSWCNGNYNATTSTCDGQTGYDTYTISELVQVAPSAEYGETQRSYYRTTDGSLWGVTYNGTWLYLRNTTDHTTWNLAAAWQSGTTSKSQSIRENSTDSILMSYGDGNTNGYFASYDTRTQTKNTIIRVAPAGMRTAVTINQTDGMYWFGVADLSGNVIINKSIDGGKTWPYVATINSGVSYFVNLGAENDQCGGLWLIGSVVVGGVNNIMLYNTTTAADAGWTTTQLSGTATANAGATQDIISDENCNVHMFWHTNETNANGNQTLYYKNVSNARGFGALQRLTNPQVEGSCSPYGVVTQTQMCVFAFDFIPLYGLERVYPEYVKCANLTDMIWRQRVNISDPTELFSLGQPRGSLYPPQNNLENSSIIDFIMFNNSAPYYYVYGNLTLGGTLVNESWESDSVTSFGATGWANVTKVVNSTAGSTIAYKWNATTSLGGYNETPIFYYSTTTGDAEGPTITWESPTLASGSMTPNTFAYFNATVTDASGISACVLDLSGTNYTMTKAGSGSTIICSLNSTGLVRNTAFTYKLFANDTSNRLTVTSLRTVNVSAYPIVNITSPINNKNYNTSTVSLNWSMVSYTYQYALSTSVFSVDQGGNASIYIGSFSQEDTYVARAGDGTAGILYNGSSYASSQCINGGAADDASWATSAYASDGCQLVFNFTKPLNATFYNVTWQFQYHNMAEATTGTNITLPPDAYSGSQVIIKFERNTTGVGVNISAYNQSSGSWIAINWTSATVDEFYEQKIFWNLAQNQSLSGLTEGTHNITLWATDAGNLTNSSKVTFLIDTIPPTLANVTISPSPAVSTDNLTGSWAASGNTSQNYNWFKNGVSLGYNYTILNATNFTGGDNITFSVQATDGTSGTDWTNSSTLTIGDATAPAISAFTVDPSSVTTGSSVILNMTCTDSGTISTYKVEITDPNSAVTNYTLTSAGSDIYYKSYVTSTIGTYSAKAFCQDGSGNVNVSSSVNFTVAAAQNNNNGGGGGGGSTTTVIIQSALKLGINPISVEAVISPAANWSRNIVLSNYNSTSQSVEAKIECVATDPSCAWATIKLLKNAGQTWTLSVPPGTQAFPGMMNVPLAISVPNATAPGNYRMNVVFNNGLGSQSVVAVHVVVGTGLSLADGLGGISNAASNLLLGNVVAFNKPIGGVSGIPTYLVIFVVIVVVMIVISLRKR